jgi:hypothetical protein
MELQQTAKFMQQKKKRSGFMHSEPEFLISGMDRHKDWAFIVCLVGGGQDINTGEAGIGTWIDAIDRLFPHWDMHISARLADSEYAAVRNFDGMRNRANSHFDNSLHLSVNMRSFRAENVSFFCQGGPRL